METLLIVLFSVTAVFAYFLIGIFLLEISYKIKLMVEDDNDDIAAILFALFWPAILMVIIIILPILFLNRIARNIRQNNKIKQIRKKK